MLSWDIKKRCITKESACARGGRLHVYFLLGQDINCTVIAFWSLFLQSMKTKNEVDDNEKKENIHIEYSVSRVIKPETIRNFICLCQ